MKKKPYAQPETMRFAVCQESSLLGESFSTGGSGTGGDAGGAHAKEGLFWDEEDDGLTSEWLADDGTQE